MSQPRRRSAFIGAVLAMGIAMWGCDKDRTHSNPLDPDSPSYCTYSSSQQYLWKNGYAFPSFFCAPLHMGANGGPDPADAWSVVPIADAVNGDAQTLRLSAVSAYSSGLLMGVLNGRYVDTKSYFPNGHVQFDIRLEQPLTFFASACLSGQGSSYCIPLASLNTTAFTHVSVPLSSLYTAANIYVPNCFYCINEPLYLDVLYAASVTLPFSGPILTIDAVQWTSN
jgi:hypothetical protein